MANQQPGQVPVIRNGTPQDVASADPNSLNDTIAGSNTTPGAVPVDLAEARAATAGGYHAPTTSAAAPANGNATAAAETGDSDTLISAQSTALSFSDGLIGAAGFSATDAANSVEGPATSTLTYPYNDVAYIWDNLDGGVRFSGVVIGPHTILTVSHGLWDSADNSQATTIDVYPGYSGTSDPLNSPSPVTGTWNDHFFKINDNDGAAGDETQADSAQDFAVIDFSNYTFSSYFGLSPNYAGGSVNVSGYPASAGFTQTNQVGTVIADGAYAVLDYGTVSVSPGNSGGPLWIYGGSSANPVPEVVGLVSTSAWGVQLTSADIQTILGWEAQDGVASGPSAINLTQYGFFSSQTAQTNLSLTTNGTNLSSPVSGDFNLEVITAPNGIDYTLASGYRGILLLNGGSPQSITLLTGDYGVADSGTGDRIFAGSGNDTIGGNTADTITGGTGSDFIDGSKGNQSIIGGSAGNETIYGGAGDTINGGTGAAVLIGGVPNDTIVGGSGTAYLDGWRGNQSITGGSGTVTVGGGAGDTITGGSGTEFINATGDNQSVTGGSGGSETIWGGAGDRINGGTGATMTIGGVAGDTITGGAGSEFIDGSEGNQSITGGNSGNETIWGGAGDTISGGGAANVTIGGAAGDTIHGGTGTELLDGWKGSQLITGGSGTETIGGGAGDTIIGGSGTEFINGTGGNQSIFAGSGNETIWGGAADTITGGSGHALIGLGSGAELVGDNGTAKGADTVGGFSQSAGDRIFFSNETQSSIQSVLATATTNSGNTTITFADGSTLTLNGITQLNQSFFA